MNMITMIPVEQLHHHPENPRKDLGDLTELTESIRKNGVMQNLTVVRGHMMSKKEWTEAAKAEGADKASAEASYDPENSTVSDGYMVVIGNRRMEAAKAAGLKEVPCVISDMDHRTQISTMLEENMQRADLTLYEQAQGFQMMMDLGYSVKEIGEKTGFSETTVSRRLKMAELDRKTFQKAVGKQITMDDLDQLGKIKSLKQRNELLKKYGEDNYKWEVKRAIQIQKAKELKPEAMRIIREAGLEKMDKDKRWGNGFHNLYNATLRLYEWDGKKNFIPKAEGKLFYLEDDDRIEFYEKEKKQKAEPVKKTEAEKKREEQISNAWKIADRATMAAADLRDEFAEGMTVKPSNAMQMLRWAIIAAMSDMMDHKYNNYTGLRNLFELKGTYVWELIDDLEKKIMDMNQSEWPVLILGLFEGFKEDRKETESFASGYRKDFPKWKRNWRLEQCYKWLTEFGYQMSTEEIEMMSGTHTVFQEVIG